MNPPNENVLVVKRELFDELGSFQGLNFEPEKYLKAILSRGSNFFIPRPEAENDPAYKQIIPYALIAFGKTVLHYVRGKKAGEQRLVAKGSIGIGGHMNETDESLFALDEHAYRAGVERVRLIVQDLKSFSRADTERRRPVDVRRVLDSTLEIAANTQIVVQRPAVQVLLPKGTLKSIK